MLLVAGVIAYARGRELPVRPTSVVVPLFVAAIVLVLTAPLDPGSIAPYTITLATILSALLLIMAGAIADRSQRPARLLGLFAWVGSGAAIALFFLAGSNWRFGAGMMIIASIALGASLVVYDAILCRIARPDDRDKVSSRGWALGYLGGGLLLAINLVIVTKPDLIGADTETAVRISLLSAGLWWALFTLIPVIGLWSLRGNAVSDLDAPKAGVVGGSLAQLGHTFRDLRNYPNTMLFLLAYLFFNDGIQTVITSSSLYGSEQLGFDESQLIALILIVQFVAFGGALLFGWFAGRWGAWRTILRSLIAWSLIVVAAFFVPAEKFAALRRARRAHRHRARRQPGPEPVAVQPAGAAHPRGGVLRLLPGDGARHVVVRRVPVRLRAPGHGLLPAGHRGAGHLLRARLRAAAPRRHAPGHPGRRQRAAPGGLTRRCPNCGTPSTYQSVRALTPNPAHGRTATEQRHPSGRWTR